MSSQKINDVNILTDYLTIGSIAFFGGQRYRIVYNSTDSVTIGFITDFITMAIIPEPKGFLLYFMSKNKIKQSLQIINRIFKN